MHSPFLCESSPWVWYLSTREATDAATPGDFSPGIRRKQFSLWNKTEPARRLNLLLSIPLVVERVRCEESRPER